MKVMLKPSGISHLIEEVSYMGLSRSSVDCDIHPEETLGNSLIPLAALGESLPLPPFPLPCCAPAHTWMELWGNSDY